MIQRIQTVYLLVVAIFAGLAAVLPLAELSGEGISYLYKSTGIYTLVGDSESVFSTFPLQLALVIVVLIALVAIFLYKKRVLQIRLCVFNAVLMIGFYAAFFFYFWLVKEKLHVDLSVRYALAFPLVSLVLNWLAIRAIGADEALVRSLNRIR